MVKNSLKYIGYALLLLLVALFAFFTNFSVGKLLDKYLADINNNLGGYTLSFQTADMGFLGLTVNGVNFRSQNEKIWIDASKISLALLNYNVLFGKVPIQASMYRGQIDGMYAFDNTAEFGLSDIQIADNRMIADARIFNNSPSLSANGNYNLNTNDYRANFKIENASLNGRTPLLPGNYASFVPEALNFRTLRGKVEVKNKKMSINMTFQGDFSGQINGVVLLTGNSTQLNLTINGEFNPEFIEDNKTIFDILSLAYLNGNALNIRISGSTSNLSVDKL